MIQPRNSSCRLQRKPPDLPLLLTEYADPGGEAVYFKPATCSGAIPDELLKI